MVRYGRTECEIRDKCKKSLQQCPGLMANGGDCALNVFNEVGPWIHGNELHLISIEEKMINIRYLMKTNDYS